jgi:four helix bundle protein
MLKNFRTFHQAVNFYQQVVGLRMPTHLKDQLLRAASSVPLNLAEGAAKSSPRDQRRFFEISMGSLRESQAILMIAMPPNHESLKVADQLAAAMYRLLNPKKS